jgi:Domain of unknown function (DUF4267)
MATNIGLVLFAVIAVRIIFIGGRFLAAPSLAATGYGVPAGTDPHSRAYLSAKGIRDIASGLFAAIPIAYGSAHPLGWFMLVATILYPSVMLRSSYTRGQQSGSLRHPWQHGRCNADHQWLAAVQLTNF